MRILKRLSRPVDLTGGVPWRVILQYAAPIMLSYLLQQIYVLTDTVICGQVLLAEQVAGVNDTFPLTFFFLQFAFGCTAGFSVLTAKYVGAKEDAGVRRSLVTQGYLTVGISLLLTLLSLVSLPWLLHLLSLGPENPVVYDAAYQYCFVIFLGIFAQMGYNLVCGVLRALGDSVSPLLFLLVSTALNVGLDLFFLIPLSMGPLGAALATVLAQLLSLCGCLVYTFVKYPALRPNAKDFAPQWAEIKSHLFAGVPLGFQFSILAIGIIVMQSGVVRFEIGAGGVMVAATPAQNGFGAANKLINFLMAFFNGLGSAMLCYTAQNYGKGNRDRVRRGTLQSLLIMLVICALCVGAGLALSVGGRYQYIFMSAEKITPASVHYGNLLLYVDLSMYFILGFLLVVRSAVQGVLQSGYVLGAGIAELIARVAICAFLPPLFAGGALGCDAPAIAFVALCAGDPGAWFAGSLVLLVPFFRTILCGEEKKTKCRAK